MSKKGAKIYVDVDDAPQKWNEHVLLAAASRNHNGNYASCVAITAMQILYFLVNLLDGSCWEGVDERPKSSRSEAEDVEDERGESGENGENGENSEQDQVTRVIDRWLEMKSQICESNEGKRDTMVRLMDKGKQVCVLKKVREPRRTLQIQQLMRWAEPVRLIHAHEDSETGTECIECSE